MDWSQLVAPFTYFSVGVLVTVRTNKRALGIDAAKFLVPHSIAQRGIESVGILLGSLGYQWLRTNLGEVEYVLLVIFCCLLFLVISWIGTLIRPQTGTFLADLGKAFVVPDDLMLFLPGLGIFLLFLSLIISEYRYDLIVFGFIAFTATIYLIFLNRIKICISHDAIYIGRREIPWQQIRKYLFQREQGQTETLLLQVDGRLPMFDIEVVSVPTSQVEVVKRLLVQHNIQRIGTLPSD